MRLFPALLFSLFCVGQVPVASAKPAAWYLWASQLDGRLICQQVSPGPGWKVQRGPYRDARCQLAGPPR